MTTFGAVDIGSNSVRLKIARQVRQRFVTVHEDREVTRLGETVFRSGMLEPQSMASTIKALQRFRRATQPHGTAAVRVPQTRSRALGAREGGRVFSERVRARVGGDREVSCAAVRSHRFSTLR